MAENVYMTKKKKKKNWKLDSSLVVVFKAENRDIRKSLCSTNDLFSRGMEEPHLSVLEEKNSNRHKSETLMCWIGAWLPLINFISFGENEARRCTMCNFLSNCSLSTLHIPSVNKAVLGSRSHLYLPDALLPLRHSPYKYELNMWFSTSFVVTYCVNTEACPF